MERSNPRHKAPNGETGIRTHRPLARSHFDVLVSPKVQCPPIAIQLRVLRVLRGE